MQSYNTFQNAALLILRIITAAIFYVAAWYKFPFWKGVPEGMSMSASLLLITKILSIAEPLGATAILFGFLTRLAAGGLTIIMVGAIFISQFVYHIGFVTPTSAGWNMPLAVLGGCLILIAFGAGRWSIDKGRGRR
jgi:putative oxidoreductase